MMRSSTRVLRHGFLKKWRKSLANGRGCALANRDVCWGEGWFEDP